MSTILVLGANGRLGHTVAQSFINQGWTVRAFVRPGRGERAPQGSMLIEGDAKDTDALIAAADGVDVIFNGLNPPYTAWRSECMPMAKAVIAAAKASGATHLFPGNVYNYGAGAGPLLTPDTPQNPTTVKGGIRKDMEQLFAAAAGDGVQTIILRAGDFYGTTGTGSWFDLLVTKSMKKNVLTYPAQAGIPHAWAYLPDLADTFVGLAERRDQLEIFAQFTFAGHTITREEMVSAAERAVGRPVKVRGAPWAIIGLLAPFIPSWREINEMRYLWNENHSLDDTDLQSAIGNVPHTPVGDAIAQALRDQGIATVDGQPDRLAA